MIKMKNILNIAEKIEIQSAEFVLKYKDEVMYNVF